MERTRPAPYTVAIDEESVEALKELVVDHVAQACNQFEGVLWNNSYGPAFNIRDQILANARTLWAILEKKRQTSAGKSNETPRATPQMEIVVLGTGDDIRAAVVRNAMAESGPQSLELKKFMFLKSSNEDSAEAAMQKLLELTMMILEEESSKSFCMAKGDTRVTRKDVGSYYWNPTCY